MKFRFLFLFLLLPNFIFLSCHSEKNLDDFKWLIGKWAGTKQGMVVCEIWQEEDRTLLNGEGIVIAGNDTIFHEHTKIQVVEEEIFYVANVPENPEPVAFKLTHLEKNKIIFENPSHDFPKKIIYAHFSPDSLKASVEGNEKGRHKTEEFYFKKTN